MLFEPLKVKGITLRNRYVMPPMVNNMGIVTDQAKAFYRERAKGGVGLVIVEATHVDRFSDHHFVNGLKHLTQAVHDEGAAIAIQLFHNNVFDNKQTDPTLINIEQISRLKKKYVYAAQKARESFFDGVEPHGAHGFFLNQFFSPERNQRMDKYGGSLENRMKMGLEIVKEIKANTDQDMLMLYRHTPVSMGYSLEDSIKFVMELEKTGVDIIDISPSTASEGEHAGLAGAIKSKVDIPVIAVGGMDDPENAQKALEDGKSDLVAVARGLIADPYLPKKVMEGKIEDIIECTYCDEKCFGNLRKGIPISCVKNPNAGKEFLNKEYW